MWEQFSYYGMRALLVYYMTKQLLISQEHSSVIYGTYTAFAYFTPIIGGVDRRPLSRQAQARDHRRLDHGRGHFMMAFEPLFYFALATIALGNGLFLPSLPSQINDLYAKDDPRRGWAYNVYYVGINVGGFLAPLICGTLGESTAGITASARPASACCRPGDLPLLVIFLTPLLVALWTKQAGRGREPAPAKKMAMGAFGVSLAFLLLALVDASAHGQRALGVARRVLRPVHRGRTFHPADRAEPVRAIRAGGYAATSIAAWYFASFGGNLLAGALGTLWSAMGHASFFGVMAGVAALAGTPCCACSTRRSCARKR
jgi:MFS family permease